MTDEVDAGRPAAAAGDAGDAHAAAPRADRTPVAGPLGRRLLGWFLVFSLLPLLVTNGTGYLRSRGIIERLAGRYLSTIAGVEAQHIRGEVDRQLLSLQTIAGGNAFLAAGAARLAAEGGGGASGTGSPRAAAAGGAGGVGGATPPAARRGRGGSVLAMGEAATPEAVRAYLARKLAELPAFEALFLLLPEGGGVVAGAGTDPAPTMVAAALARWNGGPAERRGRGGGFEELSRSRTTTSPPRYRALVPVTGEDGALVAYLGGVIGPHGMEKLLEIPPHLAGSIESFIVDADGVPIFISHAHGEPDYARPLAAPPLRGAPGTFVQYADRGGKAVIGYSVAVAGLPWRYLIEAPVKDTVGPLQRLRTISLYFALLFALVLVVGAWIVAGGVVAPVRRLVVATRRVGAGDLSVRVDAAGRDEIDELGRAFNEMTAQLAETSARVEELHQREIGRAHQLATVGELASGVAHEIKNPLIGISNGLELVQRRLGHDAALSPILEEIARELHRIDVAIRDLLAFARPATPTLTPTEGAEIVERAVRLVRPAAERAGVALDVALDPELPPVPVDPELMQQAVVNLLMNAIHATSEGGRVTVGTAEVPGEARLFVRDTGSGMAPETLEHIFKPFFTTRHAGTGLGLSITREIVERHRGRIDVRSRVGEGSSFTIALPLAGNGGAAGDEGEVDR